MWCTDSLRVMAAVRQCVCVLVVVCVCFIVSASFSPSDGWKGPGQHRGAEYNQKSSDTAENHHSLMITWLPSGDPALCLRSNTRYLDANFFSAEGD